MHVINIDNVSSRKNYTSCITFRLPLLLLALLLPGYVVAIEEPKFTVIESSDDYELRLYDSKIIAETLVTAPMDDASSAGFRLIANYIFGNNTSVSGAREKISMTAPVTLEQQSEKIDMTAPVTMKAAGSQWRVHFVMPSEYSLETLPTPNNPAVTLRKIPETHYAVIKFSGFSGENKVAKKTAQLLEWLKSKNIEPTGTPELARYNAPWTPPFLRRNEVMISY